MHPFSIYFRMYYIFELAFYVQALVAIFLEERTDDFWILVTHHIATIFLVFGSYLGRSVRRSPPHRFFMRARVCFLFLLVCECVFSLLCLIVCVDVSVICVFVFARVHLFVFV